MRARFYNPVIGRFTQEDTYRGDGLNLYAYCGNNPVAYYDPSGYLCSTKINQYNKEVSEFKGSRLEYLRNKFNKRAGDAELNLTNALKYRRYIRDIETQTGRKIPMKQISELKNALKNKIYSKLPEPAKSLHRESFNKVKKKLINKWEKETGQKWPEYTQNVINPENGKVSRHTGNLYDAHEIIPNAYGGPKKWWNVIPAKFPNEHQGGIHRKGGIWRILFPDL